jgi:hypothetical protein
MLTWFSATVAAALFALYSCLRRAVGVSFERARQQQPLCTIVQMCAGDPCCKLVFTACWSYANRQLHTNKPRGFH